MSSWLVHISNDPYYWLFPVSILLAILFVLGTKKVRNIPAKKFLNGFSKFIDFWLGGDLLLFVVIVLIVVSLIIWR